ncbi:MAG: glutathione peroxidase [Sphingobacteriales bacterium]|nr:glutathione peroxidase [Sphingobacteriales bacterium]
MKILFMALLAVFFASPSVYDFKVEALSKGKTIDLNDYKGKKILIVNTASKCGFTPQYEGLEKLYETYKNELVIIGFPANNFGAQEPGSNEEIGEFCKKNYGVSFPMAAKVSVKGNDIDPLFKWLLEQSNALANSVGEQNAARKQFLQDPIKWNFTKFLLDEKGKLIDVFPSKVNPMDEAITKYLGKP